MLFILRFNTRLLWRGIVHDRSKFTWFEAKGFGGLLHRLSASTYGSQEYHAMLEELKPIISHHHMNNRHHPEYYGEDGVSGMALIDLVEMFIDWQASIKKHADGDIHKSIDHNKGRHGLSDQLEAILRNST